VTFVERKVDLTFQLAQNTQTNQPNSFAEGGSDTVTVSGLRTSVRIQNSGAPADCRADVRIWGLTPSLMNQLSTLGLVFNLVPKNTLTISAGNEGDATLSPIFIGVIYYAYADFSAQPDVPFHCVCTSTTANAVIPAKASSYTGGTSVATIMQNLARLMGLGFENNNVTTQLASPYFSGSAMDQVRQCAEHAGISFGIVGSTLAIWPRGGNRNTPNIPVISKANGKLIGYPAFTQQGIIVKSIFDPTVSFGSLIRVESELFQGIASAQASANANIFPTEWAVNKLDLALDAKMPKGDWMSTMFAYNPNYSKTIIPPPS
jgi:hypothetical protein